MFTTHSIGSSKRSKKKTVNLRGSRASSRKVKRNVPEEFRTFSRKKKRGPWGLIFFLALIFSASVAGYYYWSIQTPAFQGESALLTVDAPKRVVSGDEVKYSLEYKNNDLVKLTQIKLSAEWPDGFYFNEATSDPIDQRATTWELPDLLPGQTADLDILGQLVGVKDEIKEVIFRLSYEPENFSSEFQVKGLVDTTITDTKLDLAVTSVDKILPGQDLALQATFKNTTKETLFDLRTDITLPPDLEGVTIEPSLENNTWVGDLQSGEEITININGKIASDAITDQNWVVEIGQVSEGQVRRLIRARKDIELVNPNIAIDLKINGRTSDFEADWGETLVYSLELTNITSSDLTDLEVSTLMDSTILDFDSYKGDGNLVDSSVIFNQETTEELRALTPGAKVTLDWQVNIVADQKPGRVAVDNVSKVNIQGLEGWQKTSPLLIVSVGDGLSFKQGAYYHLGGIQVGSGPLPPTAGNTTNYLIIWSLDNGTEDFTSVTASTFLPPNVTFITDDTVDEGDLDYDTSLRRVTWNIDNFQSVLLPLQASFEIRLEPQSEDVGDILTLINETTVVASGGQEFQTKVSALRSSQVISTKDGDIGTVVE